MGRHLEKDTDLPLVWVPFILSQALSWGLVCLLKFGRTQNFFLYRSVTLFLTLHICIIARKCWSTTVLLVAVQLRPPLRMGHNMSHLSGRAATPTSPEIIYLKKHSSMLISLYWYFFLPHFIHPDGFSGILMSFSYIFSASLEARTPNKHRSSVFVKCLGVQCLYT